MVKRILVVDDEPDLAAGWATALELDGYKVKTASDGTRAAELCDETDFDLVILDFIMPGGTGVEVLGKIRQRLPQIRSIIVSGKLDPGAAEQEITDRLREQVEADRYLHKPLKNEQLLTEIKGLLSGAREEESWKTIAARAAPSKTKSAKAGRAASQALKKLRNRR